MERGLFDEDVRTIPRWQAQELVPSARLRPGAHKQVLKEDEEDALELVSLLVASRSLRRAEPIPRC